MKTEAVEMQPIETRRSDETVLEGVTIENVQERLRGIGVRPKQRVVLKVVNPWDELFNVIERVSDRAESLGLTEEKIESILKEE
jgi:hypothetical protein